MRSLGPAGEEAFRGIAANSNQATAALERLDGGIRRVQSTGGGSKAVFQQLGYQVGDFAVQVQSGTSEVTAFVQQGSQIAGAFGPVGAVIGAVGAVLAGLVTYLSQSSKESNNAEQELKKLSESSDEYRATLERLLPLQQAYLQGLVEQQKETERATRKQEELSRKLNEDPGFEFTGGKPKQPTYEEYLEQRQGLLPNGGLSESEFLQEQLRRNRRREDEGINRYLFRDAEAAVGKFETKPPYETSDEYREAQRNAEDLARKREQAAKAASREAEQRVRIIRQLELQADATKRLADATGEGTYATKLAEIENENQRRIMQASQTLTGKQLEQAKALSNEIAKLERQRASVETALPTGKATPGSPAAHRQAEREGFDQFGNVIPIDKNKATDEAKQFAEQQYRVLLQPWQDLASSVSGIMSDMYADILTGAENLDFGSIASSFSDTINTAISGALGNLTALPINTAIQTIATQAMKDQGGGVSGALYDFYQNNPRLTGAAVGTVVGQVGGQALGFEQSKYSGLTSSLGAAGGAALGFYLGGPVGAMIGGSLGGLAGNALGGLFGGENNLGNDRSTQTYSTGQGDIVYSDRSFSQGNRNITSGIIDQIQTIQEALGDLGATFSDFNLRIEAGNKSGITVNGVKYDTAEDALKGAIGELLTSRTGGLTDTQQTILANTKGGTAAEIGQDLAFGQTYDRLIEGGNQFDVALKDLYETFRNATTEATKLGLATDGLAQAHIREFNEVNRQKEQAQRGVYEQIAAARGDNSLGTQLFMLETQMRELAKAAQDLGIPLELVTEAHEEAARRITENYDRMISDLRKQAANTDQSIIQAQRGAYGAVDQFLDPIKQALGPFGIGQGVYSPAATAQGGLEQFREVLARAQGGDTQALSSIVGIGQQTLQAARSFGASGAEFQAIFKEVNKGLLETQGQLEERRMKLAEQGISYQRETLDEVIRLRVEQVQELRELREQLRRDLALAIERRA